MPKGSYSNNGMSNRLARLPQAEWLSHKGQLQEPKLPIPKLDAEEMAILKKLTPPLKEREANRLMNGVLPSVIKKLR